jgi:hypothetical protein
MPNWSAPLQRAHRNDRNGYIICLLCSSDERDMHKISCGPEGTHIRPHGDVLPHMSPCVHHTLSIQRNTLSTNQEQAHGSKGPQPRDNYLETPQAPPYPPWDPPGSHMDERRREQSHPGIGRPHRLSDPTLRPLVPPFHVSACHDEPKAVPGACPNIPLGSCISFSWKIDQLSPHSSMPRVTTSLVAPKAA